MSVELTQEQQRAVTAFEALARGERRRVIVGGYAGTGKSTIIAEAVRRFNPAGGKSLVVCTPTGKAAHVLRSKGVPAMTLHSLLYRPRERRGEVTFVSHGQPLPDLAIVDEASMLSKKLMQDLERDVRYVFYSGDHGQLEPIGDDPGLMKRPDIRLEKIHRQSGDSEIIPFAHELRQGREPVVSGRPDDDVCVQSGWTDDLGHFDVIIVGINKSRMKVNNWVRKHRGYSGLYPQVGETVICLRNCKHAQVWNGMMGQVLSIDIARKRMSVDTDDGPRREIHIDPRQFGNDRTLPYVKPTKSRPSPTLWDFGYALTAHKCQGSEFERVAVVDEQTSLWDPARWRYTAATRAKKQLRWVYK